jgi:hypothetical protein
MKRWLPAILLICAVVAATWYLASRNKPQSQPNPDLHADSNATVASLHNSKSAAAASGKQEAPTASPVQSNSSPSTSVTAPSAPAKPLPYIIGSADAPPTNFPPEIVVENMRRAIINYGSTFSGNPVGTNPEIAAALNGENPKQIKFIDPENGLRINGKGELVDSWGTPFFFHQLSATDTEVRSAGPDKIMWTADDLVIK